MLPAQNKLVPGTDIEHKSTSLSLVIVFSFSRTFFSAAASPDTEFSSLVGPGKLSPPTPIPFCLAPNSDFSLDDSTLSNLRTSSSLPSASSLTVPVYSTPS